MFRHWTATCLIILALSSAHGLFAQTAENPQFRAYLRSPAQPDGLVIADFRAHVLRDAKGVFDSGGACTRLRYDLREDVTLTGVRIHRDSDGRVVLQAQFPGTALRGNGSLAASATQKIQVPRGDRAGLEALRQFLEDPTSHYVTLATREQPEGVFRGPVWTTERTVLMSLANAAESAIPGDRPARVALAVDAALSRDASGKIVMGEVSFLGTYHFPAQVTFTGLHIRAGSTGAGPIVISAPFTALASHANGTGAIWQDYTTRVLPENEAPFRALAEVVRSPESFSVTLEAGSQPDRILRGRLRRTDQMDFQLQYNTRNVVPPPTDWDSGTTALNTLFALRREDGSVAAAAWYLQWMFRFPEASVLRSIQIRRGRAGTNGPVVAGPPDWAFSTELPNGHFDGAGFNGTNTFDEGEPNNFINDLVAHPEEFYSEARLEKYPEGAFRAQFSTMTQLPVIDTVLAANLDPRSRTLAPGGLISIIGRNLAKVGTGLNGWEGQVIPESLNSVVVGSGPWLARLLFVSPAQINAQLPFDLPTGARQLAVNNGNGLSNVVPIQVDTVAPAIFGGVIVKQADSSIVDPLNPAQAGDAIIIYATGMGQTTPALSSGRLVNPDTPCRTVPVTAAIGAKAAEVLSSAAAPGFPGVYQVVLRVPVGAGTGNAPLILRAGATTSNTVSVAVR